MTRHAVNRIPIVEDGRVIGIVTRADLLRTLARPDEAITTEVRWRLQHELWINPDELRIETLDGIVTVSGTVETRTDAELVRRWVVSTDGVVDAETKDLQYTMDDRRVKLNTDRVR